MITVALTKREMIRKFGVSDASMGKSFVHGNERKAENKQEGLSEALDSLSGSGVEPQAKTRQKKRGRETRKYFPFVTRLCIKHNSARKATSSQSSGSHSSRTEYEDGDIRRRWPDEAEANMLDHRVQKKRTSWTTTALGGVE